VQVRLGIVGLVVSLAICAGCSTLEEANRATELPTVVVVEILPAAYTIDGERVNRAKLETRLSQVAQDTRRANQGRTKARVRLVLAPGAPVGERDALVEYCLSIGLDKIETPTGR
jgi:hypothetical protein